MGSIVAISADNQEDNNNIVNSPLNSIFIKGTLGGTQDTGKTKWFIDSDDVGEIINLLIIHLNKYKLSYSLDDNCNNLINELKKSKEEFLKILMDGTSIKKNITDEDLKELEKKLKPIFKRKLTTYQLHSLLHILTVQNGANFSVPGSGKTSVILAYYHILKSYDVVNKLFVIGPASSFEPWEKEYFECYKECANSQRLSGVNKNTRKERYLEIIDKNLLLTTYHSAANDQSNVINLFKRYKCLLVLDESHYIKKPGGGKLVDTVLHISKYAKRRAVLTGTPMPNDFADVWSQITFLWPKYLPLGDIRDYIRKIKTNNTTDNIEFIKERINPLFFRVTKKQLNLPKPKYHLIKCNLSPIQTRIYKGIAEKYLSKIFESREDRETLMEWRKARSIRLLQVAVNPALLTKSCPEFTLTKMDIANIPIKKLIEKYSDYEKPEKIINCCSLAREIATKYGKVIIWSSFIHNLNMLSNELKDLNPVVLHGGIPYSSSDQEEFDREKLIQIFKHDTSCKVFIANPAACAESISLHKECHNAIYLDRSFNCAHYLQSLDRIHRLGLKKADKTNYYFLVAERSIDEIVDVRLNEKIVNMGKVIDDEFIHVDSGYWGIDDSDENRIDEEMVDQHIKDMVNKIADNS